MKFSTVQLDDNKIEIFNSYLGKETIKLNGVIVSEKNSISGGTHIFKIVKNDKEADCKIILGYGSNGVVMDLFVDNVAVIQSPKSSFIIIFIIVGFIIGIVLVQMLYHNY